MTIRFVLCAIAALTLGTPGHPVTAAEPTFVYGSILDLRQTGSWLDLDTLATLKFNTLSCWATRDSTDWSVALPRLDSLGLNVWGTNGSSPYLSFDEQGAIIDNLHKRSRDRCLYSVWEAEDTTAFGNPVLLQLRHPIGRRTANGWEVRWGRDDSGTVQTGPGLWIGGGRPEQRAVNFVEYALRLTETGGLNPETPVCRLYGTYRRGGCQYASNPVYDTALYRRDFDATGMWMRVLCRYQLAADTTDLAAGCDRAAGTAAMVDFNVDWFGLGALEIDWTRAMDSAGWELVLGPEELRRGPIKRQAAYFRDTPVVGWFGDESAWFTPYKTFAYFFVDSLIREASEGRAHLITDLHIGNVQPEASWDYFMYTSLVHGERVFYPWISPFREGYSWAHNLDSLQARCYDTVTAAVQRYITRWLQSVPDARWVPYVQCWSDDPRPDVEVSPTGNDVVCLAFLYLTHGAKGLMFHRYDGGTWSNRQTSWGLVYDYRGQQRTSMRFYAIRNRVTPLIVDQGWGDTLMTLRSTGAGSADTVRRIPGSFVRRVRSDKDPMYLEIGFFEKASGLADYVMLVNRRTTDIESQRLSLELDPSRLAQSRARFYRVTNMRTYESETVPGNRPMIEAVQIAPGDPAFFRIEAVEP